MVHLIEVRRGNESRVLYAGENGAEAARMWEAMTNERDGHKGCPLAPGWIIVWENAEGDKTFMA
jgi:hypothetical protein